MDGHANRRLIESTHGWRLSLRAKGNAPGGWDSAESGVSGGGVWCVGLVGWLCLFGCRYSCRVVGLPGKSIPIIVEPLRLPDPAREPRRGDDRPVPRPTEPVLPGGEPVGA